MTVANRTFKKAIVFVNTVQQIVNLVAEAGIDKKDCAIICGDSIKNDLKISGIHRLQNPRELPMITFVTSSGFSGIDLYDHEAMTFVVSNTNKSWQMIDFLTDLKQAISRQRDKTNPNYNTFIYIFNQSLFSKSEQELIDNLNLIRKKIEDAIWLWKRANEAGKLRGWTCDNDFLAYTHIKNGERVINEQAFNADKYFILELRKQYTKGFDIRGEFEEIKDIKAIELPKSVSYSDLVKYFNSFHCSGTIDWGVYSTKTDWITIIESSYKLYKKTWSDITYAKEMIGNYGNVYGQFGIEIKGAFAVGTSYSRKEIKDILSKLYTRFNMERKAKHSDLKEFFIIREFMVKGERKVEIKSKKVVH